MLGRLPRPTLLGETVPVAASNAELETRVKNLEWSFYILGPLVVYAAYKGILAVAMAEGLDNQLRKLVVAQPRTTRRIMSDIQDPRREATRMRQVGLRVRKRRESALQAKRREAAWTRYRSR